MAATLLRSTARIANNIAKRSISFASVRFGQKPPVESVDIHRKKYADQDCEIPDDLGHAVGEERFELLAEEAGDDDPFNLKISDRKKGTFEDPTIVKSSMSFRSVACVCEEDSLSVNWMQLYEHEPKRCECGYWFKLEKIPEKNY